MKYEVYFDESNKLDQTDNFSNENAYYGVIGWNVNDRLDFDCFINNNDIYYELHFSKYRMNRIEGYIKAIEYCINKVDANFYVVDKSEAFKISENLNISKDKLRKLFYLKIPERLIYGMTRKFEEYTSIDIYIDRDDEYGSVNEEEFYIKLKGDLINVLKNDTSNEKIKIEEAINKSFNHIQLARTLSEQLNSQAVYRGLSYSINKVKQVESTDCKSLQVIDVLLGIIKFLYEKEYLDPSKELNEYDMDKICNSNLLNKENIEFFKKCYECKFEKKINVYKYKLKMLTHDDKLKIREINKVVRIYSKHSIAKAELVYRLFQNENILNCFFKFNIFLWVNEEKYMIKDELKNNRFKEVTKDYLGKYIANFFKFKNNYDTQNRLIILKINKENKSLLTEKDYRLALGFGQNEDILLKRYLNELRIIY